MYSFSGVLTCFDSLNSHNLNMNAHATAMQVVEKMEATVKETRSLLLPCVTENKPKFIKVDATDA